MAVEPGEPLPQSRPVRPLAGFFVDLAITVGAMLVLSVACGAVWAAFTSVQVAMQGGAAAAPSVMRALGEPGAVGMMGMTLVSTGGAALWVYGRRRRATREEREVSHQAVRRIGTWAWMVATATATVIISWTLGFVGRHFGIEPQPTNQALIEAAFATSPVFMLLFAVVIAPAYEELLFRRVLFGRLWASGRPWLGVLLSSAAFALMHELPGTTGNSWQATGALWLIYGLMGAAFAFVYWHTRTLWAAIGAHALNNAIALAMLNLSASH